MEKMMFFVVFLLASALLQGEERGKATFAAGCFWCAEHDLQKVPGVIEVVSGYTGGHQKAPSYQQVSHGGTGHYEAVEVVYDPKKVSYEQLLKVFWRNVDPTDGGGQFCDRGDQYRAAIFYHSEKKENFAEASKSYLLFVRHSSRL